MNVGRYLRGEDCHVGTTRVTETLDSNGKPATFKPGDRVLVLPNKMNATVERQILHYDCGDTFWGNLELLYDDGVRGISNSWQVRKLEDE